MTAKSLTHKFVNSNPDDASVPTLTRPSNWNDDHNFWLGQRVVVATTNDTLIQADHFSWVYYNVASSIISFVPAPTTGTTPTFQLGWTSKIKVVGAGTITLTPATSSGVTFNGSASPIPLFQGDAAEVFSQGTTDYVVLVYRAAALLGNSGGGGILKYVSATALSYKPFNGNYIRLNKILRPIGNSGIAGLATTSVFINGVAGQNLAANTLYLIYAFDNNGVLTADFCTGTTHGQSTTPGNEGTEVKFTGGTEDPTRTLLGMAIANGTTPNFTWDGIYIFGVATWNNRHVRHVAGTNTGTVAGIGSGTPIAYPQWAVYLLHWADALPTIFYSGLLENDTGGTQTFSNVVLDGNTAWNLISPSIRSTGVAGIYTTFGAASQFMGTTLAQMTEGWHTYSPSFWVTSGSGNSNTSISAQVLI
jgi:hypothetical protein